MRVYVAGSVRSFERIREVQALVRDLGHEITYDWTAAAPDDVWKSGGGQSNDDLMDAAYMAKQADADRAGVLNADLIIALAHPENFGTIMEIGMALAVQTPIVLVGDWRNSVFWFLDEVQKVRDDDELLILLEGTDW